MAASVRIEDEAFSDVRYEVLAALCGLADADHARGKMAKLWRQCTAQKAYVLPVSLIATVLGENGVRGLEESRLGEVVEGGIRIRGTRGRIEWLSKLRKNSKLGGNARSAKRKPNGSPDGSQEPAIELPPPCPPAPAPAPILTPTDPEKIPPPRKRSGGTNSDRPVTPGHAETISAFHDAFKLAYQAAPSWDGRKAKQVNRLVTAHGAAEVQRRIAILFSGGLAWPHPPYDLDTLVRHFDKLATPARVNSQARDPTVGRVEPEPPHAYPTGDLDL